MSMTRDKLLFTLGSLSGELAREDYRSELVEVLSAPRSGEDRIAGYLMHLRDQLTALLRDSGVEKPPNEGTTP